MKKHTKKIIAPVVITVILLLYFIGYASICLIFKNMPVIIKILGVMIPLLLAGVCIFVLVERIKEIRSGEEDDLSKY